MTERDDGLSAFFDAARRRPRAPSEAFLDRLGDDALAEMPRRVRPLGRRRARISIGALLGLPAALAFGILIGIGLSALGVDPGAGPGETALSLDTFLPTYDIAILEAVE